MSNVTMWNPNTLQYESTPDPDGKLAEKCCYPVIPAKHVVYEPKAGDWLECEHGPECCWQRWDGFESLEAEEPKRTGDNARHALTVLSRPPTNVVTKEILPSVDKLARALFDTDEEVRAYVMTRCDNSVLHVGPAKLQREGKGAPEWLYGSANPKKFLAAMDACWRVDDRGDRTKCLARAQAMIRVLK